MLNYRPLNSTKGFKNIINFFSFYFSVSIVHEHASEWKAYSTKYLEQILT